MSVFTRGPYGRLAVVLNTLSSINIEIIIIIIAPKSEKPTIIGHVRTCINVKTDRFRNVTIAPIKHQGPVVQN